MFFVKLIKPRDDDFKIFAKCITDYKPFCQGFIGLDEAVFWNVGDVEFGETRGLVVAVVLEVDLSQNGVLAPFVRGVCHIS
jgi:hypothetical protein